MKDVDYRNIHTGKIVKASEYYRNWSREIWHEEKAQGLYDESETAPPYIAFEDAVTLGCDLLDTDDFYERI
jgi:hypothetical protein